MNQKNIIMTPYSTRCILTEMVNDNEKKKIKQFIVHKSEPEWVKRKAKLVARSGLNDEFDYDLKFLLHCTEQSLIENYFILVKYFVKTYNLDPEIVEAWILSIIHKDQSFFARSFQADHIRIKYVKNDTVSEYDPLIDERIPSYNYVELRIGRSVHRKDLKDFIDKNWVEIEKHIVLTKVDKSQRIKNDPFMNLLIRNLRKSGLSFKEIRRSLDDHPLYKDNNELTDAELSRVVKPINTNADWLKQPKRIVSEMIEKNSVTKMDLKYKSDPFEHFYFDL